MKDGRYPESYTDVLTLAPSATMLSWFRGSPGRPDTATLNLTFDDIPGNRRTVLDVRFGPNAGRAEITTLTAYDPVKHRWNEFTTPKGTITFASRRGEKALRGWIADRAREKNEYIPNPEFLSLYAPVKKNPPGGLPPLKRLRLATQDPATMPPGEIEREIERIDAASSLLTDRFIALGRGHERPSDLYRVPAGTDPLADYYRALSDRRSALTNEIELRAGPGHYGRFPYSRKRGDFGPRRRPAKPDTDMSTKPNPQILGYEGSDSFVVHKVTGPWKGTVSAYFNGRGVLQDAEHFPGGFGSRGRPVRRDGPMWQDLNRRGRAWSTMVERRPKANPGPSRPIPNLGSTSTEVLNAALAYPRAGYELVFQTVFDGEYRLHADGIHKSIWRGTIPLIGPKVSEDFLRQRIQRGEVSIFVQSPGKRPHYSLEIHRATGQPKPNGLRRRLKRGLLRAKRALSAPRVRDVAKAMLARGELVRGPGGLKANPALPLEKRWWGVSAIGMKDLPARNIHAATARDAALVYAASLLPGAVVHLAELQGPGRWLVGFTDQTAGRGGRLYVTRGRHSHLKNNLTMKKNPTPDRAGARELFLHITNTGRLYREMAVPRMVSGRYSPAAWELVALEGARDYAREYGRGREYWREIFDRPTLTDTARQLAAYYQRHAAEALAAGMPIRPAQNNPRRRRTKRNPDPLPGPLTTHPNIMIEDRTRGDGMRNFAWRIRFLNGTWSGWHDGYHSHRDAHLAAKTALNGLKRNPCTGCARPSCACGGCKRNPGPAHYIAFSGRGGRAFVRFKAGDRLRLVRSIGDATSLSLSRARQVMAALARRYGAGFSLVSA